MTLREKRLLEAAEKLRVAADASQSASKTNEKAYQDIEDAKKRQEEACKLAYVASDVYNRAYNEFQRVLLEKD